MLRNIGSNWFLMAVTGLATFFLMPFNLAHLGNTQYGIWLVISALTAYLSLLHLGVPMASVRHMAQAITAKDTRRLNQIIASCAVLYIALGIGVALIGLPLLFFFERDYVIPSNLQDAARLAFGLSLVQTGLGFLAYMPYAILSAYQAFVPKNALMAAAVLVRIVANVVLVLIYPNLVMLGIVILAVSVFELLASWGYVLKRYPEIRPRFADINRTTMRDILGFSAYVFLMALGYQLAFQSSALIIGHEMTAADVVSFAIPNSLMLILMQFITGIASVIMPLATSLQTQGDNVQLRAILYRWTKIALALSWCAGLFLLVFGPAFLQFWIKGAYTPEAGHVLRILMASYLITLPIRGVATPLLMGLGKAKWPTIATIAAGILNVLLSILWVRPYGLEGVAWSVLLPNMLLAGAMVVLVCRALRVPVRTYLGTTLPLSMIGGLAALSLLIWWDYIWQPTSFFGLAIAGLLTVLVTAALWGGLVLRHDRHVAIPPVSDLLRGRFA
jgi:O-antigen/teichoic acid export membrane protein